MRLQPNQKRRLLLAAGALSLGPIATGAHASSAREIDGDARRALQRLYGSTPSAKVLGDKAKAVLVFPSIVKAGFGIGGQYGEGALIRGGKTVGYYSSAAVSYGLQIGAQTFGYAMFLMSKSAMDYLDRSDGWEIGAGPSVVLVDEGVAKSLSSSTARNDIYAFVFGQKGLMAGISIEGSKIHKISPDP
jgi:lipid-binding SYLF domain-containing protein